MAKRLSCGSERSAISGDKTNSRARAYLLPVVCMSLVPWMEVCSWLCPMYPGDDEEMMKGNKNYDHAKAGFVMFGGVGRPAAGSGVPGSMPRSRRHGMDACRTRQPLVHHFFMFAMV